MRIFWYFQKIRATSRFSASYGYTTFETFINSRPNLLHTDTDKQIQAENPTHFDEHLEYSYTTFLPKFLHDISQVLFAEISTNKK